MVQSTLFAPAHVALIMDGNGRWAERRNEPRTSGHLAGARAMRTAVEHCARVGVRELTLYAFSSDNWKRPAYEVNALLALFTSHFTSETEELARHGIRISVIGRRDRLPRMLRRAIRDAEERTRDGNAMHLRIAIDYSSREAIRRAHTVAAVATDDIANNVIPAVDLLVRTGGERRLSDFLLWECAYAELLFLDVLWPDITPAILDEAFADFARRDRRFGNVPQRASA